MDKSQGLMLRLSEVTPFFLLLFSIIITLIGFSIRSLLSNLNEKFSKLETLFLALDQRMRPLETHKELIELRVKTLEEERRRLVRSPYVNKETPNGTQDPKPTDKAPGA